MRRWVEMMNKVILIGRLTKDPTLIYTQKTGTANSRMTIAVDRRYKNQEGEKQTDFIPVVAWGKLAETVANYMKKGKLIAVEGSLETRKYEQNGITKYIAEVIANDIRFLEKLDNEAI